MGKLKLITGLITVISYNIMCLHLLIYCELFTRNIQLFIINDAVKQNNYCLGSFGEIKK